MASRYAVRQHSGAARSGHSKIAVRNFGLFFVVVHVYPLLTTKRIALLSFERDVCTRLGIAFFEVSVPSVFHVKVGASR